MAACIPYPQWLTANAACKAASSSISVKGFGYVATGSAGLRGLGDSIAAMLQSAAAPPAPPVVQQASIINTTPATNDPNDPCYIASQTPCPMGTGCPAVCPTGFHSIDLVAQPGKPALCNCTRDVAPSLFGGGTPPTPTNIPLPAVHSATAPPMNPGGAVIPMTATMTPPATTAGFQHWGLLAAVVVGGGALYLVTRKKKAA